MSSSPFHRFSDPRVVTVLSELVAPGIALLYRKFLSSFPASQFRSCPPGHCKDGSCEQGRFLHITLKTMNPSMYSEFASSACPRCAMFLPWLVNQRFDRNEELIDLGNIDCGDLFSEKLGPLALFKLNVNDILSADKRRDYDISVHPMITYMEVIETLSVFVECFDAFTVDELDMFRAWVFVVRQGMIRTMWDKTGEEKAGLTKALVGFLGCDVVFDTCPSAEKVRKQLIREIEAGGGNAAVGVSLEDYFADPQEKNRIVNLVEVFLGADDSRQAIFKARENLAIRRVMLPAGDVEVTRALLLLERSLSVAEEYREAEEVCKEAVKMLRTAPPAEQDLLAEALMSLGMVRHNVVGGNNQKECAEIVREALRIREGLFPPDHENIADVLFLLSSLEINGHMWVEAITDLERALKIFQGLASPPHEQIREIHHTLSQAYPMIGKRYHYAPAAEQQQPTATPAASRPQPALNNKGKNSPKKEKKEKEEKRPAVSEAERERLERELLEDDGAAPNSKSKSKSKSKK